MKFTPKELEENVNVSKTHPLADFAWMLGGLVAIIAMLYLTLAITIDLTVEHIPVGAEVWLGEKGLGEFPAKENVALQERLDALLATLPVDSQLHEYEFHAYLSDSPEVNAIALPGGNIVVFAGLLREVQSENELAMILSHELGHFAHRDHLRGIGRGIGLSLIAALLFGDESAISNLVSNTLVSFQALYSQEQEEAADAYGLQLLEKRYQHVGGASDFFDRAAEDAGSRFKYLFASHPHPNERIEHLRGLIRERGYVTAPIEPLAEELILPDKEEN